MFSRNHVNRSKSGSRRSNQNQNGQSARKETPDWPTNSATSQLGLLSKHLFWFRMGGSQRPKVVTLIGRFGSSGMNVRVLDAMQDIEQKGAEMGCALIILECVDMIEQEMLSRLDHLRAHSNAPLIVLTDNATLDWSLLALREGADAIFTLNTPDEVILARSTALLRRWAIE